MFVVLASVVKSLLAKYDRHVHEKVEQVLLTLYAFDTLCTICGTQIFSGNMYCILQPISEWLGT